MTSMIGLLEKGQQFYSDLPVLSSGTYDSRLPLVEELESVRERRRSLHSDAERSERSACWIHDGGIELLRSMLNGI